MTRTEAPVDDCLPGLSSSPDRRAVGSTARNGSMDPWQVLGRILSKGSEDAEARLQKAFQHPPATKARRQAYFCWTIQVDKAKTSSFYAGKIG